MGSTLYLTIKDCLNKKFYKNDLIFISVNRY